MPVRRLLATALLLAAPLAPAATLTWPALSGGGPCAGTLQACVDAAAAGDTVLVGADDPLVPDAYTAISEPILVRKSLTLAAAPGIDAVFAPGASLAFDPNVPGPHAVTFSGLVFRQGSIDIRDNGTAAGSVFRIERVRVIEPAPPNVIGCAINFQLGSPSPQIIAGDNVVSTGQAAGPDRSGICAYAMTPAVAYTANVFRNRITAGTAILRFGIALSAGNGGRLAVSANSVLGPRMIDGISLQRAEGSAPLPIQLDNNVVALQDDPAGWGVRVEGGNSTATVVNNTIAHGSRGLRVAGFLALPVAGRVANNLVAFNAVTGISLDGAALGNSHNLVFGNPSNSFTPGPSTLTVDPRLQRPGHPRLESTSPAIDAGNTADLPALVEFDADGERRRTFIAVDIGAFEANGDGSARITATAPTVFFNETYVTPFPIALTAGDTLVGVARYAMWPQGASALNLGVYRNPGSPTGWSLFLQDLNRLMPIDAGFHVLAPVGGNNGFVHATTAGNVAGALSTIDETELLNGMFNRARIAVPFHFWENVYHDFPIGLRWVGTGGGRWQVRNEDGTAMPAGQKFNVAVAPFLSPNAFRTTLDASARTTWRLDHPLLDANPCATPIVGRVDDPDVAGDTPNPTAFGVAFLPPSGPGAPGRWVVRADAPSGTPTFPPNAAFNVIIDGAEANRCRAPAVDALFANGFE
jgi:hypothetical protein